jgi:hypothetical protein
MPKGDMAKDKMSKKKMTRSEKMRKSCNFSAHANRDHLCLFERLEKGHGWGGEVDKATRP